MQKTAQKRNIWNRLREMSNISGIAMEKLYSDEFQKAMEDIRQKDNKIRAIASGKVIDKEDPGPDPISLKDLLKSAKSNFGHREYMIVIDELGRFHKKMLTINTLLKTITPPDQDQEDLKVHRELLLRDLDPERRSRLSELGNSFASTEDRLIAEAGIEDFLAKLPGSRGRALSAWERAYPEHVKQIKKDTQTLLNESERLLTKLLGGLKEMASARSVRSPGSYRKAAAKITGDFANYHSLFEGFYKGHVKDFRDIISKAPPQKAQAVNVPDAGQLGQQPVGGFTPAPVGIALPNGPTGLETEDIGTRDTELAPDTDRMANPPIFDTTPSTKEMYDQIQSPGTLRGLQQRPMGIIAPPAGGGVAGGPPAGGPLQPPPVQEEEGRKTLPFPVAHRSFYQELESLSSEHPLVLANFIRKYATNIQFSDPETSIELLKIVRSIKKQ